MNAMQARAATSSMDVQAHASSCGCSSWQAGTVSRQQTSQGTHHNAGLIARASLCSIC